MQTLFIWDGGVIYAATELHIYSLHLIPYADFNSDGLTDKLYSTYATALYKIAS